MSQLAENYWAGVGGGPRDSRRGTSASSESTPSPTISPTSTVDAGGATWQLKRALRWPSSPLWGGQEKSKSTKISEKRSTLLESKSSYGGNGSSNSWEFESSESTIRLAPKSPVCPIWPSNFVHTEENMRHMNSSSPCSRSKMPPANRRKAGVVVEGRLQGIGGCAVGGGFLTRSRTLNDQDLSRQLKKEMANVENSDVTLKAASGVTETATFSKYSDATARRGRTLSWGADEFSEFGIDDPLTDSLFSSGEVESRVSSGVNLAGTSSASSTVWDVAGDNMIAVLVQNLQEYNAESKKTAVHILREVVKDLPEKKFEVVKAGGIPPLVALLKSADVSIVEDAVVTLLNLALTENCQSQILGAGGIKNLVQVMERGKQPSLVEAATSVLVTLCHDEEAKTLIWVAGAIKPLIVMLEEGSLRGKKDAATVLMNLSAEGVCAGDIVYEGAVDVLLSLALDPALEEKVTATLRNLCRMSEGCAALYEKEAASVLQKVLERGSARAKEDAAYCLLKLSEVQKRRSPGLVRTLSLPMSKDGSFSLARAVSMPSNGEAEPYIAEREGVVFGGDEAEIISGLVDAIQESKGEVRKLALRRLRNLVKNQPKNKMRVIAAGGIEPLVALLQHNDVEIIENAVTTILNLSLSGEKCREEVITVGGIDALVDLLEHESCPISENAAASLFCLSSSKDACVLIRLAGGVRRLVKVLKISSLRGKKDAALALFNLSLDPGSAREIVSVGAVKVLLGLALDVDLEEKAVAVLAKLAQVSEGRVAIYEEGGVAILADVLEGASRRAMEDAATCLLALATYVPGAGEAMLSEGVMLPLVRLSLGAQRGRTGAQALIQLLRSRKDRTFRYRP